MHKQLDEFFQKLKFDTLKDSIFSCVIDRDFLFFAAESRDPFRTFFSYVAETWDKIMNLEKSSCTNASV